MRIIKIFNKPLLEPKRQQVTTVLLSLTLLCAAIFMSGCSPADEAPNGISDDNVNMALASNSRNSLDWAGSYQGVLPCASCEGIETTLTLHANNTYQLESVYLGKDVDNRFQQNGIFSWDTKGSIITLDNIAGEARSFRVEEQGVRQLDLSGQMVTGSLAELYRLNKLPETVSQPSKVIAKFTDVDWQLTELLGQAVSNDSGAYVHFSAEGKVFGNAGCNQFAGGWELEQYRLKVGQLALTMRACAEEVMQLEQQFLAQLALADNYSLADNSFSLNKARMAPLARFEVKP